MTLTDYSNKRDITRTPKPSGARPAAPSPPEPRRFVIQKHAASRLHDDFRLQMHGVFKSWAIPKGIPFKQGDKHLAIQVEDHPADYAGFEGNIARDNYGAGTVMIWDQGTYEAPDGNPSQALAAGKLRIRLHGAKLEGEWTLIRTHVGEEKKKPEWLLIKTNGDAKPVSGNEDDESADTHRTMEGIGLAWDPQWDPDYKTAGRASRKSREIAQVSASQPPNDPVFEVPMHPRLVDRLPVGDNWIYELKFDGYRAIGIKNRGTTNLLSRNELDLGGRFPEAVQALAALPCDTAAVDGEIVAVDENGAFSFHLLENAGATPPPPILYYLFDLLQLNGKDLTGLPLIERKQTLQALLAGQESCLKFSAAIDAEPARLVAEIERRGLEGIVAKQVDSHYESGRRSGAWVKWNS